MMSELEKKEVSFLVIEKDRIIPGCGPLGEIVRKYVNYLISRIFSPDSGMMIIIDCGWSVFLEAVEEGLKVKIWWRDEENRETAEKIRDVIANILREELGDVIEKEE